MQLYKMVYKPSFPLSLIYPPLPTALPTPLIPLHFQPWHKTLQGTNEFCWSLTGLLLEGKEFLEQQSGAGGTECPPTEEDSPGRHSVVIQWPANGHLLERVTRSAVSVVRN